MDSTDSVLNFPNQSRSFDAKGNRVRFWGHVGASEICFFVEADALSKLNPKIDRVESGFLKAFDAARSHIQDIAIAIYMRSRERTDAYFLAAKDF